MAKQINSTALAPCRLLIFKSRTVGLISFLFLHLTRQHGFNVILVSRFFFAQRQDGSGNLVRRLALYSSWKWSTFAAAKQCALRQVLSRRVQHLGGVRGHNVPPAVEDFLPAVQWKDCVIHPSMHLLPVLCKAVGENDSSTCTEGVEQCCRKEVAACSGQRVLEGFHHSNVGVDCSTSGRAWEAQCEKQAQCGPEQHRWERPRDLALPLHQGVSQPPPKPVVSPSPQCTGTFYLLLPWPAPVCPSTRTYQEAHAARWWNLPETKKVDEPLADVPLKGSLLLDAEIERNASWTTCLSGAWTPWPTAGLQNPYSNFSGSLFRSCRTEFVTETLMVARYQRTSHVSW